MSNAMDNQDRSEARAEYRNARQSSTGKGDADTRISQADKDKAVIWCDCFPARFKDKCERCHE